jgi:CubicO group peptidase (beta-lactamase class C family)
MKEKLDTKIMKGTRKHISKTILWIVMLIILSFQHTTFAQDKAEKIDKLVSLYAEDGYLNGAVLVADNGKIIYQKAFGLANLEWEIPNQVDCKFEIYSLSKQFTTMLIMKLIEAGKIKLDACITNYLPYYRKDTGDKITIHHLLTHSHGIAPPDWNKIPHSQHYNLDEFVKTYLSGDLMFEPGTDFHYGYSGRGYIICAAIIEQVTGKTYQEILKEKILDPLSMKNTDLYQNRHVLKKRASTYRKDKNGYTKRISRDPSQQVGASSMYSTLEDLYLWDQALYSDRLLSKESKEMMFKPHIPASGQHYGYGWRVTELSIGDTKKKIVWHSGGGISLIFRSIEDGHLIILLNNTYVMEKRLEICHQIINILYGQPYTLPKKSIAAILMKAIFNTGIEQAIQLYHDLKANHSQDYNFSEKELDLLGHELLYLNEVSAAIEIFKLNIEAFPESSEAFYSLGKAYMENDYKTLAIKNLKKSLELNPRNENAKQILKILMKID